MTTNGNTLGDAIYNQLLETDFYHPSKRQQLRERAMAEAMLATMVRRPDLDVQAEDADVIEVAVQVRDGGDTAVAEATTCIAWLRDDDMSEVDPAAFHLAETGVGAEVSTTQKGGLIFTTDANGAATLSVTDVGGASGATKRLIVEVISGSGLKLGQRSLVAITFD